jgi:hypothetical protein
MQLYSYILLVASLLFCDNAMCAIVLTNNVIMAMCHISACFVKKHLSLFGVNFPVEILHTSYIQVNKKWICFMFLQAGLWWNNVTHASWITQYKKGNL